MPEYLRVKNWETFQHYRDRNPPWIKLHASLLYDYEFTMLAPEPRALLLMIWLLASQHGGRVPNDPAYLQHKLMLPSTPDLSPLTAAGFLVPEVGEPGADPPRWASRYVPQQLREEVFKRARNQCQRCGTTWRLEIDHIVPISEGGTGDRDNLQVLCRSCNRMKRGRSFDYRKNAPQKRSTALRDDGALARSREERREEAETEKETTSSGKPDIRALRVQALEVLTFLNDKTGRNYQPVSANVDIIVARLRDGATLDDLRAVVAKKCREWAGDEKMSPYLRPATLFNRTKFAQYQGELGRG